MFKELAAFRVLVCCVLFLVPSSINADTDPTDASVLSGMYSSLHSPSQLTSWSSSSDGDPCRDSWKGIKCSGSKVTEIDISGLGLSGSMGFQLDKLTSLTRLDVSNNNIGNQIPYQLPANVQYLNLAANGFNGAVPYSISQMSSLQYLNVSHNQIQGRLNDMFGSLGKLSTLDFSFNSMTDDLPQSFSSLTNLNNMYLDNNQFTGSIDVLAGLPLQNLNVENNRFNGYIPAQLNGINLRTGGNSWTSGPAPPPPPGTPPVSRPSQNHKSSGNSNSGNSSGGSSSSGIGGGAVAGIVISVLVVGAIVAFFLVKKKSRRRSTDIEKLEDQPFASLASDTHDTNSAHMASPISYEPRASVDLKPPPITKVSVDEEVPVLPVKPVINLKKDNTPPAPPAVNARKYSIADLQMATDSFSDDNLIGEGSVGRVYRAQFDDGKVMAVKKIKSSVVTNPREFMDTVSEISRLHHPNVTELEGYCSEYGQHLLVYTFLQNGSLHEFLHLSDEYSQPLTWNSRVQIALGSARALEYLHEICSPSVIHKNFKSANILLDTELNPHLSDCGLASLLHDADQALNNNGGSGYSAPEVSMSGQYTIKGDVYSFGVVMLELLTGRQPFDSCRPRSEQSLVRWATPQLHDIDALAEMVDPALKGLYSIKSLSRFADVIALCVQAEPEFRPAMSEVVESLERLVQRANLSMRIKGNEHDNSPPGSPPDDLYL